MAKNKTGFTPQWYEDEAPKNSYRSLFKWGGMTEFKHPNKRLFELVKEAFEMTDGDFENPHEEGLDPVSFNVPIKLAKCHQDALRKMVGDENIQTSDYDRLRCSYGAGMIDLMRMRKKIIENLPDIVVCPRDQNDLIKILHYCDVHHIPLNIRGGGSTVTRGYEAVSNGVALDMTRHMNRILDFNELDQTITVEAGIYGPALEDIINHAPERLGAKKAYTAGHFPQSFEYSTVGGWVVTKGAGQNSTYFGKIEDMVLSQEYVLPGGVYKTPAYPRYATGPDMNQVMMGSEGCFGVLSNVTLKLRHYQPENTRYYGFIFNNWQEGEAAMREIIQGEFGLPSVFRLSDGEETDVGLKLYGVEGTIADRIISALGYQPMERCLMLGTADGDGQHTRMIKRKIQRICRKHGAFDLSIFGVAQMWEHGRFRDPYLREDLQDFGILTDTLECAVRWSQVSQVHDEVRKFVKSRPNTICTSHISHVYPQGCNLYFIFFAKIDEIDEYLDLQYGVLEAIKNAGAAMSHHHGIGKQTAPWFKEQIGEVTYGALQVLKDYFDPNNILNPGGTLGFDLSEEQKEKRWGYQK